MSTTKISPFFLIMGLTMASCLSTKVVVNSNYPNGVPIDTLNLVSTMIGPVWQPVVPLIDAAAFNEKTNKIAAEIMDVEQQMVPQYQVMIKNALDQRVPGTVRLGKDLNAASCEPYRVPGAIQVDNKNFPIVFFADGDLNFTDFGKGKNVYNMFVDNASLQTRIAGFAKEQGLNNIMLSYNRLAVAGVGMFGTTGNLRLESYLYLYDARGNLVMDGYAWSKPITVNGKDLSQYRTPLDDFRELTDLLSQKLTTYIK